MQILVSMSVRALGLARPLCTSIRMLLYAVLRCIRLPSQEPHGARLPLTESDPLVLHRIPIGFREPNRVKRLPGEFTETYSFFWNVKPWTPLEINRRLGGTWSGFECYLPRSVLVLDLFSDPEDGDDIIVRNVGWISTNYTAVYWRR